MTWAGVGRAPAWIANAKNRDDFLINKAASAVALPQEPVAAKRAPRRQAAVPAGKRAASAERIATRKAAPAKKAASAKVAPVKRASAKKVASKKAAGKATSKKAAARRAAAKRATAPASEGALAAEHPIA